MNASLIIVVLFSLAFLVIASLVVRLRPRLLGARGQAVVSRKLRRYCSSVADDLLVPDGRGGMTQIDHLVLTYKGLLVVETKNYNGLIFGQAHDRTWTQCIGRQRHQFENPLRQNFGHVKAVEALAPGIPVTGLVVFTNRARFLKGQPNGVTALSQLAAALPPMADAGISGDYRRAWDSVRAKTRDDRESRLAHLEAVSHRK